MKKLFLGILIAGICLSMGLYFWQTRPSQSLQAPEVTPGQLRQMIEDRADFYVYFYSPACKDCIASEPKLAQAAGKTGVNMVKLDIKKHEEIKQELEIPGSPSIFLYQDGKLIKGITGSMSTVEEYEKFFRETGDNV